MSGVRRLDEYVSGIGDEASVDEALARLQVAHEAFAQLDQKAVDKVFSAAARHSNQLRLELALAAVEDTGMGLAEDKVLKNNYASEYAYHAYLDMKTCGVIHEDESTGVMTVAQPAGPIAAITPTTNPTSTVIMKALFALKTRNAIMFLPHPRAERCSNFAAQEVLSAAIEAGAPPDVIQCMHPSSKALSSYVMRHPVIKMIIGTGGPGMLKAMADSGKPCIGVGSGNCPVVVDETADLQQAISSIVIGKTFDNGVICASEQSTIVVGRERFHRALELFTARGVHFIHEPEERARLQAVMFPDGKNLNAEVVGKSAKTIASMANLRDIPQATVVLGVLAEKIGDEEPFSLEKLSPVLTIYQADDYEEALQIARAIAEHGGLGHTAALYTKDAALRSNRVRQFEEFMPCNHCIINMPTSLGAIGCSYNFNIAPTLSLGVGPQAGSILSGNLTPSHLLNIKQIARKEDHIEWFQVPPKIYFNRGCTAEALRDLASGIDRLSKCAIISDRTMKELGLLDEIATMVEKQGLAVDVFEDVAPDPTMSCIQKGVEFCKSFQPDVMIAFGGGSPMDAAKMIRLLYEHPELRLEDLVTRFLEIRHRSVRFPNLGSKVHRLICIPTTSGTGSECTPFAVVTSDDQRKYPVCSYQLTPDTAIIDSQFTNRLPKSLIANAGYDALVHSIESFVSTWASDYTRALSLQSAAMVSEHLVNSYQGDALAREKMHNAAAIAGMAFSNAFLGICHSLAHQLGAEFHIPHGLCNALLLQHVIRYNSSTHPTRMAAFPQYQYPRAAADYARLADHLGLTKEGHSEGDKINALLDRLAVLMDELHMPRSIHEAGVDSEAFNKVVDRLAEQAFDDQCTGTNPRYPLIQELKEIYLAAFENSRPAPIDGDLL